MSGASFNRLPSDFLDRLSDLLCTVHAEQIMMRSDGDEDRLQRITRLATRQSQAQVGLLYLVSEDRGDLQIAAATGDAVEPLVGRFVARVGLAGFAIDDGNPVAVADSAQRPDATVDEIDQLAPMKTNNSLAVPLIVHGQAQGALELRNSPNPRGFTPADMELATELAYLAGAAVEEYRGDRFLFSLFASALPGALDEGRGSGAESLTAELQRWLEQLRQTPAWRKQLELVTAVRTLCIGESGGVALAQDILQALVTAQLKRKQPMSFDGDWS